MKYLLLSFLLIANLAFGGNWAQEESEIADVSISALDHQFMPGDDDDLPPWVGGGDDNNSPNDPVDPPPTNPPSDGDDNDLPPWLEPGNGNGNGDDNDLPPWLEPDNPNTPSTGRNGDPVGTARDVIAAGRDIVALGEDLYKLVIKGKPQTDVKVAPVSIVPTNEFGEIANDMVMTGWQVPFSRRFRMELTNRRGKAVAEVIFNLNFSYDGKMDGVGHYIKGLQITPEEIDINYGKTLDIEFKVASVQNYGTVEDPIAGATIEIGYKLSSMFRVQEGHKLFYVTGLGKFGRVRGEIEDL